MAKLEIKKKVESLKIYFVTAGNKDEIEVIKKLRPNNILISYFYFKKSEKIKTLLERIDYRPNILLDSGGYSAMTQNKDIALTSYIKFIYECLEANLISEYVQLDVLQKPFITLKYYEIMISEGLKPIPVYHYGENEKYLDALIEKGENRIALGGTVPISNKTEVANWLRLYCWIHPNIDFHLLGSSSSKILNTCDIYSVDSSTWIMMSANGLPSHIKSKKERMAFHMSNFIEYERKAKGG